MLTQIINAKILTPQGWLKNGSVILRDNKNISLFYEALVATGVRNEIELIEDLP